MFYKYMSFPSTDTILQVQKFDEQKHLNVFIRKINDLLYKADNMVKAKTKYNTLIYICFPYQFWRAMIGEDIRMAWSEYKTFSHTCYSIRQTHKTILSYFDVSETELNNYSENKITCDQCINILNTLYLGIREQVNILQIKCNNLNEFYLELMSSKLDSSNATNSANSTNESNESTNLEATINIEGGTKWLKEIVRIYKFNGGTAPCSPDEMMKFFKANVETFSDEDFYSLIHLIEQNLGNTSFDVISNNLRNFVYFNWDDLPLDLKEFFVDISTLCIS